MPQTAVIAGVGPGFGERLAWKLAEEGYAVGLFARTESYLERVADDLRRAGHEARGVPTDITDPEQVRQGFEQVRDAFGPISVLSVQASTEAGWGRLPDLTPESFKNAWQLYGYAPFLCVQTVIEEMVETGGTILVLGTPPRVGRGQAHGYASARGATRQLVESLARELWPKGVHIAHVGIDGAILNPDVKAEGTSLEFYDQPSNELPDDHYIQPDAVVQSCWDLIEQDRSGWSLNITLRPNVIEF